MISAWVRRFVFMVALAVASCSKGGSEKPPPPDDPVAALEQAGATFRRAENRPGKPVLGVYFKGPTVSEQSLGLLKRLPSLNTLGLGTCQLPPGGVKQVASLTNLSKLYLNDCTWVTDADLKELAALKNLRELYLTGCDKITDAGLKELLPLQKLVLLELGECKQIGDVGVKELGGLKNLQRLGLFGCDRVSDATVAELKKEFPKGITIDRTRYDFTRTAVRPIDDGKEAKDAKSEQP